MTWNPIDHTQGLRIISSLPLPAGIAGLTDGHTIWLNPNLTPAGRRCTLAHELIHIERGVIHHLPDVLRFLRRRLVVNNPPGELRSPLS